MTRTLVMGDIHGAYTQMMQCLERAMFDPATDWLIQLGDVIDGKPGAYACVEHLLTIPNLISLKGNHDDWFLEFITTGYHPGGWAHGGKTTIESYGQHLSEQPKIIPKTGGGCKTSLEPADIPASHQQFFKNQQLYYIDENNNCFVHGGFDRAMPFFEQPQRNYYWNRTLWTGAMAFMDEYEQPEKLQAQATYKTDPPFNEIFIGHTPTTNWGTDQPMQRLNIWNLDTGVRHQGRITVMDVATKEYWQSDKVE